MFSKLALTFYLQAVAQFINKAHYNQLFHKFSRSVFLSDNFANFFQFIFFASSHFSLNFLQLLLRFCCRFFIVAFCCRLFIKRQYHKWMMPVAVSMNRFHIQLIYEQRLNHIHIHSVFSLIPKHCFHFNDRTPIITFPVSAISIFKDIIIQINWLFFPFGHQNMDDDNDIVSVLLSMYQSCKYSITSKY